MVDFWGNLKAKKAVRQHGVLPESVAPLRGSETQFPCQKIHPFKGGAAVAVSRFTECAALTTVQL